MTHLLHDVRIGRFNQNDAAFRIGEEEKDIAAAMLLDRLAKVLCRLFDVTSSFAVLRRQIVRDELEVLVVCEHVVAEYRDEHECGRDNERRADSVERIAEPSYGFDQLVPPWPVYLLAQPRYAGFHDVRARIEAVSPYPFEDHVP